MAFEGSKQDSVDSAANNFDELEFCNNFQWKRKLEYDLYFQEAAVKGLATLKSCYNTVFKNDLKFPHWDTQTDKYCARNIVHQYVSPNSKLFEQIAKKTKRTKENVYGFSLQIPSEQWDIITVHQLLIRLSGERFIKFVANFQSVIKLLSTIAEIRNDVYHQPKLLMDFEIHKKNIITLQKSLLGLGVKKGWLTEAQIFIEGLSPFATQPSEKKIYYWEQRLLFEILLQLALQLGQKAFRKISNDVLGYEETWTDEVERKKIEKFKNTLGKNLFKGDEFKKERLSLEKNKISDWDIIVLSEVYNKFENHTWKMKEPTLYKNVNLLLNKAAKMRNKNYHVQPFHSASNSPEKNWGIIKKDFISVGILPEQLEYLEQFAGVCIREPQQPKPGPSTERSISVSETES